MCFTYLVSREQEDIGAREVHLVTLSRVNSLLLNGLNLQRLQLLIKDLTLHTLMLALKSAKYEF